MKADFLYRNNQTVVRYLDYDNNQLAGGQNIWSLKLTADYSFSKKILLSSIMIIFQSSYIDVISI
jgi:cell surface protein SprA